MCICYVNNDIVIFFKKNNKIIINSIKNYLSMYLDNELFYLNFIFNIKY